MAFAIIAAGGGGSRLGGPVPKFEMELEGRPLVSYSLEVFEQSPGIESIVLVVPVDRVPAWSEAGLRGRGVSKLTATVAGGATRRQSVAAGLAALEARDGVVLVHDAARPLVTVDLVERACRIPDGADGLVAAVPVTDTVKRVDREGFTTTLERETLFAAQTPQAFRLRVLREAHLSAERDRYDGTDDASLVERLGGRVMAIEGSRDNIKVTFGEDLAMARSILLERGAS